MTRWTYAALIACLAGCGEPTETRVVYVMVQPEAGEDAAAKAGEDAGEDADSPETDSPAPQDSGPDADSSLPDASSDEAPDTATDASLDQSPPDAAIDDANEPDAPEPVCTLGHVGDLCEDGTADWRACCPGLVCQQTRCVDPDSGVDGATACPCHCEPPDGGVIDCTHGGCGCTPEGEGEIVYINAKLPLCPALWVCYGPASAQGCDWRYHADGNQVGGYCYGKEFTMIRCAPCYQWKPC